MDTQGPGDSSTARARSVEFETLRGSTFGPGLERGQTEADRKIEFDYIHEPKGIKDLPRGYLRLAREQVVYPNYSMVRAFEDIRNFYFLHEQEALTTLYRLVVERDRAYEQGSSVPDVDAVLAMLKDDPLFEEIERRLSRYEKHLEHTQALQTIQRPSLRKHQELFYRVLNKHNPDMEKGSFVYAADDFVYTAENPVETVLDELLFDYPGFWLFRCFRQKRREGEDNAYYIRHGRLHLALAIIFIICASVLVMLPVGIIYLGHLSDAEKLVIVILFGLLFTSVVAMIRGIKNESMNILICLFGYLAVILTVLANLGSSTA